MKRPSLTYLIAHMEASTQKLHKSGKVTPGTMRLYKNHAIKFGAWCKLTYQCRTPEDCRIHIQDYADYLSRSGKSASTIHTYMAGVCRWFGVSLDTVNKPRRIVSENTRSRGVKAADIRTDTRREISPRLYDFACRVGIRRVEYTRLRGCDFTEDESGYPCVVVKRGKGGKKQLQRILPEDVETVRAYFDGSDQRLFTTGEMNNKIDLHHLRAVQAQRAYRYYAERLANEPNYRAQLADEVRRRFAAAGRPLKENGAKNSKKNHGLEGYYRVRGGNRQLCLNKGIPTRYDRLAVMAVSVFHLSHWRCDVTVDNYLLSF